MKTLPHQAEDQAIKARRIFNEAVDRSGGIPPERVPALRREMEDVVVRCSAASAGVEVAFVGLKGITTDWLREERWNQFEEALAGVGR